MIEVVQGEQEKKVVKKDKIQEGRKDGRRKDRERREEGQKRGGGAIKQRGRVKEE